jgi:hypothetical protein
MFIIRHGEKPPAAAHPSGPRASSPSDGPPHGVDIDGNTDPDSLIPRGWQRAGALATLFAPTATQTSPTQLAVPTSIATPSYGTVQKHRTYQTVLPTALKLELSPNTDFAVGREAKLVDWLLEQHGEVVLVCWEHDHIIDITDALGKHIVSGPVPGPWPSTRFDIVVALWSKSRHHERYVCSQVPQMLLAGDSDQLIPPASS